MAKFDFGNTLKKAGDAAKRPPLSSRIGKSDIIKHNIPESILPAKIDIKNEINFSAIIYPLILKYNKPMHQFVKKQILK